MGLYVLATALGQYFPLLLATGMYLSSMHRCGETLYFLIKIALKLTFKVTKEFSLHLMGLTLQVLSNHRGCFK